jgi:hypothetical protein
MKIDQKMLITTVIALMIFSLVNPFVKNAVSGILPVEGEDSFQDDSVDAQLS